MILPAFILKYNGITLNHSVTDIELYWTILLLILNYLEPFCYLYWTILTKTSCCFTSLSTAKVISGQVPCICHIWVLNPQWGHLNYCETLVLEISELFCRTFVTECSKTLLNSIGAIILNFFELLVLKKFKFQNFL